MIYETIQDLCRKRKVSVRQMENDLKFYNGTVRRWDDLDVPIPLKKIKAVAKYLHVDPYTLLLVGIDMDKVEDEEA